ncbi:cytochrome P450 3A56-like isoform X2 [Denticeps clupeoides]|uniref:cytochrome P450 3A56-like isoform X2 n=1 Tax=Denticeps clupeoides TaxID=299321 RepID=UPI0010A3402D|nr:cytochrome P450 3A56-like isoform X2 [Denticeps clupeoides]
MTCLYLSPETWTLLACLVGLIAAYGYWPFGVLQKLGIPGPKPTPFFGTSLGYRKGLHNFDLECFKKFGKLWGIYDGRQPVLCILDPAMIKTVLIKECHSLFTNRRDADVNGPLHDALTVARDDTWRRIRSTLSPLFTSGRLKEMFGIVETHSQALVKSMARDAYRGKALDMKEFFAAYSVDVVASTAFSVDIDSLNNPKDPFVTNIKKLANFDFSSPFFVTIGLFPFLIPVFKHFGISIINSSVTEFFCASLQKIKSERTSGPNKKRVDFLQLMLDSQGADKSEGNVALKGLNDHEILSQSIFFIFAGYETTSSTLTFLFYNLATHPDVMKKLQEEIDEVFPNAAPVQYEDLMKMDCLDSVMSETLRLFPVAGRIDRECKKTVEIHGVTILKGMAVMVPTYVLHRDPDLWSDPESFKPERFSKENKESVNPHAYMPFGAGPRNCIGMRFALMVMKLAVVKLLQQYSFVTCEETQIPLELDRQFFLTPKKAVKLRMVPRGSN